VQKSLPDFCGQKGHWMNFLCQSEGGVRLQSVRRALSAACAWCEYCAVKHSIFWCRIRPSGMLLQPPSPQELLYPDGEVLTHRHFYYIFWFTFNWLS
jgi:hypothetical protein